MKNFSFWTKSLLLILLFGFTTQNTVAQTKTYKEVPQKLHGFWQFDVKNRGDWNGMHVGKNYIENFYSLAKVDSVVQKKNTYTLHLTYPNRRDGRAIIEVTNTDKATITFTFAFRKPIKYDCKRLEAEPDIELLPVSEYPKAIDGTWIMGSDIRKPLSIHKNILEWNAEEWQILWLGEYLKREFRALIEKNGEYKLIYITPQNDNSKKFVFGKNAQFYHPIPLKSEQNMLYGTWCDKKTNEWIIGFFDKIAVYQNQSWKYKVVQQKKNKYTVELQKGDKKQTLFLTLKGKKKDKCKLKDDKTKRNLFYVPRPLPYNYPDTKPFANNGYKMDSVTINGYLQNCPNPQKPFEISLTYPFKKGQATFYADIDKNGCFSIKIPILNTRQIYLDWNRSHLYDVVEPNETYFIYIDYAGGYELWNEGNYVVWNMGKNARLHREIIANLHNTKIENHYIRDYQEDIKNTDDLLNANRKIYKRKINQLNRYIANNPILSERFKTFVYKNEIADLGYVLMQNRFKLDWNKKELFSKEYQQFVDSLFQKIPNPYTLIRKIGWFIRDYAGYYKYKVGKIKKSVTTRNDEMLEFVRKEKLYPFSKEEEAILDKVSKLIDELEKDYKAGKDSIYLVKKATAHKKDFEDYSKILQKDDVKQAMQEVNTFKLKKIDLKEFQKSLDSIPVQLSQDVKDLLFLREGLKQLEDMQIRLFPFQFDFLTKNIKNDNLRKILTDKQQKYIDWEGQSIEYMETLKRTAYLKDAKDADELLKKLIAPYLGKVIYLDIWGTWCGPCKREMKYVKKVKKAMKGKDVIFMYLANNSPEKAWKNVIKKYNITGKNVVHYNLPAEQQSLIERRLDVRQFPTFIIIDKKGNIVNMNPPYPSYGDLLINELNKWLKK